MLIYGEFDYMLKQQSCDKCHKEMRFEFWIDDDIWSKLPDQWRDGALCIECFLEELEKNVPDQEFDMSNFHFLSIVGSLENWDFGGILIDTT